MRSWLGSAARFVIAGAGNTIITGLALSGLALIIDRRIAYTIVFALGLVLSTWLAGSFVFRVKMSRRQIAAYVALYVAVYLVGLVVMSWAARRGLPDGYSGLVVLITAPLTFIGGRFLLVRPGNSKARDAAPPGAGVQDAPASKEQS